MQRREFITLLCGTAATGALPFAARAQKPAMPVIGFLRNTSQAASANLAAAFRRGLNEAGYSVGQNVAIEYRWAEGQNDRLPGMAADLVRRRCAVIIGGGNAAALAVKAATTTIPIIFATGDEPIQLGLVASLNRPTGNVTGVFFYSGGILVSKQLELLHEVMPKTVVIGMLVNPTSPAAEPQIRDAQAARFQPAPGPHTRCNSFRPSVPERAIKCSRPSYGRPLAAQVDRLAYGMRTLGANFAQGTASWQDRKPAQARRLLQSDRPPRRLVAASRGAGRRRHQFQALRRDRADRRARQVRHGVLRRQRLRARGQDGGAVALGAVHRQFRADHADLGARRGDRAASG